MKWLTEECCLPKSTQALNDAAAGGNMDALAWLKRRRAAGTTTTRANTAGGGYPEAFPFPPPHQAAAPERMPAG
jgi:hypothetical protein